MDEFSFAQKQRLAYIDFKLYFTGKVTRSEIVTHFELGLAAATRDLKFYKDTATENMVYDNGEKKYVITTQFNPISIIYPFLNGGSAARKLVPHSIVDNGLRWHLRTYDRKSKSFRYRITKVTILAQTSFPQEDKLEDHQWMHMVPLQTVPHPIYIDRPTAIKLDFGMEKGMLEVNVRAAMAGCLLRRWNVDCSENGSLSGPEYQLYLQNSKILFGARKSSYCTGL